MEFVHRMVLMLKDVKYIVATNNHNHKRKVSVTLTSKNVIIKSNKMKEWKSMMLINQEVMKSRRKECLLAHLLPQPVALVRFKRLLTRKMKRKILPLKKNRELKKKW